jgi:predicted TIM-barrel fold metal-dependent hydrolase
MGRALARPSGHPQPRQILRYNPWAANFIARGYTLPEPIIDIHVHIIPHHMMKPAALELVTRGRTDFDEVEHYCHNPKDFLRYLDSIDVERAGLINYVAPEIIGFTPAVNDWIANYCKVDPDRLIAFGGVHPGSVADAGDEVDRIAKLGIRAIKIHPSHQALSPNAYVSGNRGLAAIYDRAQSHRLPIMIHTGTSIFPGARNTHAQPILCDEIGVDYPDLVVILAHGGRPLWMNEAFFLVRRHKNMYMDVSSIPPQKLLEYFPRLEEIADKVLWGTDWPSPGVSEMKINVETFQALSIREEVKRKILYHNAARLFPRRT